MPPRAHAACHRRQKQIYSIGGVDDVIVDGERFSVQADADRPGHYRFAWLSGPNSGYGFSTSTSDGSIMSISQIETAIRGFLAQVDPATGFIE